MQDQLQRVICTMHEFQFTSEICAHIGLSYAHIGGTTPFITSLTDFQKVLNKFEISATEFKKSRPPDSTTVVFHPFVTKGSGWFHVDYVYPAVSGFKPATAPMEDAQDPLDTSVTYVPPIKRARRLDFGQDRLRESSLDKAYAVRATDTEQHADTFLSFVTSAISKIKCPELRAKTAFGFLNCVTPLIQDSEDKNAIECLYRSAHMGDVSYAKELITGNSCAIHAMRSAVPDAFDISDEE